jgi:hypothetical protein
MNKLIMALSTTLLIISLATVESCMQSQWEKSVKLDRQTMAELPGMVIYYQYGKKWAEFEEGWEDYYEW